MFQRLLEQIARGLETRSIPYMIIGGQAVLLYGEPRLTRDIDITLGVGPEGWSDILELVKEQGWQILVQSPEEFVKQTMVLPCLAAEDAVRLDFLFSLSSYEQQALERVRRVQVGRTEVCYASLEDLIIHKIIAGRPRDLEDVRNVLLKNPNADQQYIRRWLKEFQTELGKPFVKSFDDLAMQSRDSN